MTHTMRIFDPHIHLSSRTTDDYQAMRAAGVRAVVEPACWLGQPRMSIGRFVNHVDGLLGWEPYRASEFGIHHHSTVALSPEEAGDPRLVEMLDLLRRYVQQDRVVAIGELGYDAMTPEEDEAFARQLDLALEHGLPALVHTPLRDRLASTLRSIDVVRESGIPPRHVVVDHLDELTADSVVDTGCWMGFSVHRDTQLGPDQVVRLMHRYGTERIMVNSAAEWGHGDPLATRATAHAMLANGFDDDDVDQVLWRNPIAFYAQSGRLVAADVERPTEFAGNTAWRRSA